MPKLDELDAPQLLICSTMPVITTAWLQWSSTLRNNFILSHNSQFYAAQLTVLCMSYCTYMHWEAEHGPAEQRFEEAEHGPADSARVF